MQLILGLFMNIGAVKCLQFIFVCALLQFVVLQLLWF